jgi:23S rRNA (adenine2503-C2)-methyltransferase
MAQVLLGLELGEIREVLGEAQPAFRAKQLYDALYHQWIQELKDVTTMPAALRRELGERCTVGLPELDRRF